MFNKVLSPLKTFFQEYIFYVFLAVGFLGIFISVFLLKDKHPQWYGVVFPISVSIISGGCLGAVIRSGQFKNIFSEELRSILYAQDFLENRKDIIEIWSNVSRALYESKFPQISDEIHSKITNLYFPTNHKYFQDKFDYEITIEKVDNEYIKLEEMDTSILIPVDKDTVIDYTYKSLIDIDPSDPDSIHKTKYTLKNLQINGEKISTTSYELKTIINKNKLEVEFKKSLSGSKKYEIKKREEKVYSIKANPYKKHLCKYFTKTFDLQINFPDDLELVFSELGTSESFKDNESTQKGNILRKKNTSILFPKQGFIVFFRKPN